MHTIYYLYYVLYRFHNVKRVSYNDNGSLINLVKRCPAQIYSPHSTISRCFSSTIQTPTEIRTGQLRLIRITRSGSEPVLQPINTRTIPEEPYSTQTLDRFWICNDICPYPCYPKSRVSLLGARRQNTHSWICVFDELLLNHSLLSSSTRNFAKSREFSHDKPYSTPHFNDICPCAPKSRVPFAGNAAPTYAFTSRRVWQAFR